MRHGGGQPLPSAVGHAVFDLTRAFAVAMRETYGCSGISTRQHNEPAGNQDVWHHHVHVFPRYLNDQLYTRHDEAAYVSTEERAPYGALLRAHLRLQQPPVRENRRVDGE